MCQNILNVSNLGVAHSSVADNTFAVRFAYTADTYNNPQKLWEFAYVFPLYIEGDAGSHSSYRESVLF